MNEDYLFDKKGEDAEIQTLENLLQTYRFEQKNAPVLLKKDFDFQPKMKRKTVRYAFALAAGILIASVIGILALKVEENDTSTINLSYANELKASEKIESNQQNITDNFDISSNGQNIQPEKLINPKQIKQIIKPQTIVFQKKLDAKKVVYKRSKVEKSPQTLEKNNLSEKEKFAYQQLKIALSITGTNLKFVKEKIDNTDENNPVLGTKDVTK